MVERLINSKAGENTGCYLGTDVSMDILTCDGVEARLIQFTPKDCEIKGTTVFFAGGWGESATKLNGFPSALAKFTEHVVYSVSYYGQDQDDGKLRDPARVPYWETMGVQTKTLLTEHVGAIDKVVVHSFGMVALLSFFSVMEFTCLPKLVAIEPYWPIPVVCADPSELRQYPLDFGPFKQFEHIEYIDGWFRHTQIVLAGGVGSFHTPLSKRIRSQFFLPGNGVVASDVVVIPNTTHGMHFKNVQEEHCTEDMQEAKLALLRECC